MMPRDARLLDNYTAPSSDVIIPAREYEPKEMNLYSV